MEILFRAQTSGSSEWVCGGYVFNKGNKYMEDEHLIFVNDELGMHAKEVQPRTVTQYTGRDDSKGEKIFEGDIVNIGPTERLVVIFDRGAFCCKRGGFFYPLRDYSSDVIERVGNKFDNPELLKASSSTDE